MNERKSGMLEHFGTFGQIGSDYIVVLVVVDLPHANVYGSVGKDVKRVEKCAGAFS